MVGACEQRSRALSAVASGSQSEMGLIVRHTYCHVSGPNGRRLMCGNLIPFRPSFRSCRLHMREKLGSMQCMLTLRRVEAGEVAGNDKLLDLGCALVCRQQNTTTRNSQSSKILASR